MYPAPLNPTVVLQLDERGNITNVASNIDPELKVVIVKSNEEFANEASNKPFDTTR